MKLKQYLGIAALGAALMGNAKAYDGAVQGEYFHSGSNQVPNAKAFVQKSYSPNLNPSIEGIAGSETLGLIIGNRHGSEKGHVGYFVGAENNGDFTDITALLEGNKGRNGGYVRSHFIKDLATGVDAGIRRRLVDGKKFTLDAELAGHFYDTQRLGGLTAGSIAVDASYNLGKNWSLFGEVRGISESDITGDNFAGRAGVAYNFGKKSQFTKMPAHYGLDFQNLDLGKNHLPVNVINTATGEVTQVYLSPSAYNSGVSNGTITPNTSGSSGTTTTPDYSGGTATVTGDTSDNSNTRPSDGTSTGGSNPGGDDSAGGTSDPNDLVF